MLPAMNWWDAVAHCPTQPSLETFQYNTRCHPTDGCVPLLRHSSSCSPSEVTSWQWLMLPAGCLGQAGQCVLHAEVTELVLRSQNWYWGLELHATHVLMGLQSWVLLCVRMSCWLEDSFWFTFIQRESRLWILRQCKPKHKGYQQEICSKSAVLSPAGHTLISEHG